MHVSARVLHRSAAPFPVAWYPCLYRSPRPPRVRPVFKVIISMGGAGILTAMAFSILSMAESVNRGGRTRTPSRELLSNSSPRHVPPYPSHISVMERLGGILHPESLSRRSLACDDHAPRLTRSRSPTPEGNVFLGVLMVAMTTCSCCCCCYALWSVALPEPTLM